MEKCETWWPVSDFGAEGEVSESCEISADDYLPPSPPDGAYDQGPITRCPWNHTLVSCVT